MSRRNMNRNARHRTRSASFKLRRDMGAWDQREADAAELRNLAFTVVFIGHGMRIDCPRCPWSVQNDASAAKQHLDEH
jgi:hypothetical protein